jgi:hypothetical protein
VSANPAYDKELKAHLERQKRAKTNIDKAKWLLRHNQAVLAAERIRADRVRKKISGTLGRPAATRWALNCVGIVENPPFSNSGPRISKWIKDGGGEPGWAWCQYFCNSALKTGGGEQLFSGYTPQVVAWARARQHGLRIVSWKQARQGDFCYFKFPGVSNEVCDHVGLLISHDGSTVTCVEGNTSPGNGGSQANGGGVFKRTRNKGLVAYVVSPTYNGDI